MNPAASSSLIILSFPSIPSTFLSPTTLHSKDDARDALIPTHANMGVINLSCLTLNNTRLLGLSIATSTDQYNDLALADNLDIILLESVPNPSSIDDLSSLSVKSVWQLNRQWIGYNAMQYVCMVDSTTGVFTAIHSRNNWDLSAPGGFQYDPRTSNWSELSFTDDYSWFGEVGRTFIVFPWPNTTTLYHAAGVNSNQVDVGVLRRGSNGQGAGTFDNVFTWTLVKKKEKEKETTMTGGQCKICCLSASPIFGTDLGLPCLGSNHTWISSTTLLRRQCHFLHWKYHRRHRFGCSKSVHHKDPTLRQCDHF